MLSGNVVTIKGEPELHGPLRKSVAGGEDVRFSGLVGLEPVFPATHI